MSYVALETLICPICTIKHSHNAGILLHTRLKDIPSDKTTTGYGLCEEHSDLFEEGYIAFIEVTNKESPFLKLEEVNRTGSIAHIRREKAEQLFDSSFPIEQPFVFIEPEVFPFLQKIQESA